MSEPISFLTASAVVAAIGVPLALRLVPPNKLYGFRTGRTLADRELWFRANRFAGCALLIAAAASGFVYLVAPELASGRSFRGFLVFIVPLLSALAASGAYLRRAGAARGHD